MLCPRQGANCCYIDNVKLLQDLINKNTRTLGAAHTTPGGEGPQGVGHQA